MIQMLVSDASLAYMNTIRYTTSVSAETLCSCSEDPQIQPYDSLWCFKAKPINSLPFIFHLYTILGTYGVFF